MGISNAPAPAEARKLARYEDVIKKGLPNFIEVGKALMAIKADGLYRWTHQSFEGYCKDKWNISKSYARRLIEDVRPDKCEDRQQTVFENRLQPSHIQTTQTTKEPAPKAKPPGMQDARGVAIPERLQPCFNDAPHAIRSLVKRLGGFHKEIEETAADVEGCNLIPMSIITVSIKDCQAALNAAAPTWVCTCKGRGCKKCDQRGWLQKHCGVVFKGKA